ncbi:hypothetical protein FHG87_008267 [Trinorchestia longiramus]|nr:hypothetical protein FHG87_008267 [Trinorchestia longiramus]
MSAVGFEPGSFCSQADSLTGRPSCKLAGITSPRQERKNEVDEVSRLFVQQVGSTGSYTKPTRITRDLGLQQPAVASVDNIECFSKWPYRPPGGVEEMQGGGRRVRLEWGSYITV